MTSLHAVQAKKLLGLGEARSMEIFRLIIRAEAWRINLPQSKIVISEKESTSDGGIDGTADNRDNLPSNIIFNGLVGYQVKASDLSPAKCKKEIHQGKDSKRPIKPSIKELIENGGTYVLVLFASLTDDKIKERKAALIEEFKALGCPTENVVVWDAGMIAAFCNLFASIVCEIDPTLLKALPHSLWARQGYMCEPKKYYSDDERTQKTSEIRTEIKNRTSVKIFRIDGLPGIGKTRFVCETLSEESLAASTIYFRNAEDFLNGAIFSILQKDESIAGVFVIDECSIQQHSEITRTFSAAGSRLTFITMSYQGGQCPPPTLKTSLDSLPEAQIAQLLEDSYPAIPPEVRHRLKEFADGFPRIAIILGESFAKNPEAANQTLGINDDQLLNRLMTGKEILDESGKKTQKVLTSIALFEKIGFKDSVAYEAQWLAQSVAEVSWADFRSIVAEQLDRRILQGDHFLYVTPQMLKIHLIVQWWKHHGLSTADFSKFVESMPKEYRSNLFSRFTEHFRYLGSTHRGQEFVAGILNTDTGIFSDYKSLKEKLTADFFLILTEANPEAALRILEKHILADSNENLVNFTDGRRQAINSLERIAVWKDLFIRAAAVLTKLAIAENEQWTNNATGVLKHLFSIGAGPIASTEASPEERLPVIVKLVHSDDPAEIKLGLSCLSELLSNTGGSRTVGPEYQGSRPVAELWRPRTYGDLFDAWKAGWELLNNLVKEKKIPEAAEIAIQRAGRMLPIKPLTELILDTLEATPNNGDARSKRLMLSIQSLLKYDGKGITPEIKERLLAIQAAPYGNDKSLADLKRYVGVPFYLQVDSFDKEDDAKQKREKKLITLAEHYCANKNELITVLNWLFSAEAENSWAFGRSLERIDKDRKVLNILIDFLDRISTDPNVNTLVIGGYLAALREDDSKLADLMLLKISKSPSKHFLIDLSYRSGMTDALIDLIISTDKDFPFSPQQFGVLSFGGILGDCSPQKVNELLEYVLAKPDPRAGANALQMLEYYYSKRPDDLPTELSFKILTDQRLLSPTDFRADTMTDYYWVEVSKKLFHKAPDLLLPVSLKLLENYGADGSVTDDLDSTVSSVLNQAAQKFPEQIWNFVAPHVENPKGTISYSLRHWLQKSMNYFPKKLILDWVDEKPSDRAYLVADLADTNLAHGSGSLARDIIERYGNDEHVRSAISANGSTGVFWGPLSGHYQRIADHYTELAKNEPNATIKIWFSQMATNATEAVRRQKIDEERDGH